MKPTARVGLWALGGALATGCGPPAPDGVIDLLARGPDECSPAAAVRADPERGLLRLARQGNVRYRVARLASTSVRLRARSTEPGLLELAWSELEPAGDPATRVRDLVAMEAREPVEWNQALPGDEGLGELHIAWHGPADGSALELQELVLLEQPPVERPTIVLIVIDTLSARHLSLYGYPLETDPVLQRLAQESHVFEHCYANAPWTVPSFMALFTGLYARAHELRPSGEALWEQWTLAPGRWTLAEALRAAGYRTAAFVDNPFLTHQLGLDQGFDVYDESAAADSFLAPPDPDGGIRRTAALALEHLRAAGDAATFVMVHALDVHQPYGERPPEDERAHGTEPYEVAQVERVGGNPFTYEIVPTLALAGMADAAEPPPTIRTAELVRAYDEGVRFVDMELGRFLAELEELGVLERAWVVVTADHGETMAAGHHFFAHGVLRQEVLHVPLLVRPPGGLPGGQRIAASVQLADLYPTLLELAGLAPAADLHGRSLVPLLRGRAREPGPILSETGIIRQAALIRDGWKLVEQKPALDSPPEARLSHPRMKPVLEALAATLARPDHGLPLEERRYRWLGDEELRRDVFERMPTTGLTEALMAEMKTRPRFASLMRFVDEELREPSYELYRLEDDPDALHDLAAQHPEVVAALQEELEREKERRVRAWELADRPAGPPQLDPARIEALKALGYGGSDD